MKTCIAKKSGKRTTTAKNEVVPESISSNIRFSKSHCMRTASKIRGPSNDDRWRTGTSSYRKKFKLCINRKWGKKKLSIFFQNHPHSHLF